MRIKFGDHLYVDTKVFRVKFSCDFSVCKGACCWKGIPGVEMLGGLLSEDEASIIETHKKELSRYSVEELQHYAATDPIEEYKGDKFTRLIGDRCVYSNYLAGCCSLKLAHRDGVIPFGIPLSCEMFPVIAYMDGDDCIIDLEEDREYCKCALVKGVEDGKTAFELVNGALRKFLEDDYPALENLVKSVRDGSY